MGNFFSITVSVSVDFLTASVLSMFWEYIFSPYDASKPALLNVGEGILQFSALASSIYWALGIFTPEGASGELGIVPALIFAVSFSPSMIRKLMATHSNLNKILGFHVTQVVNSTVE